MIYTVKIGWRACAYDNILNEEDADFYLFGERAVLLYIGVAYLQDVKKEIDANINDFSLNRYGIDIWLGNITESDYVKITEQIVKDVECLLIITNQPKLNTQCKKNYFGRDNLKVISSGRALLIPCVRVENNHIYDYC